MIGGAYALPRGGGKDTSSDSFQHATPICRAFLPGDTCSTHRKAVAGAISTEAKKKKKETENDFLNKIRVPHEQRPEQKNIFNKPILSKKTT